MELRPELIVVTGEGQGIGRAVVCLAPKDARRTAGQALSIDGAR